MSGVIRGIISAWQMVAKRSLAHWRLLSAVVLGVLLASAIMAGTVIYFDALRELALRQGLAKHSVTDLDILIRGERGPVSYAEYEKISTIVNREIDQHVAWMLLGTTAAAKSPTFYLRALGNESLAGDDTARTYFAFLPELRRHITVLPGGAFPEDERVDQPGPYLQIEALVPIEAARSFNVEVGDRLVAVSYWEDDTPYVPVVVSGIFERNDPEEEFWYLEESVLEAATGPSFKTVPFYISERAYMEVLGPAFRKMDSIYAWLLATDTGRLNARNAKSALSHIQAMHRTLGATLTNYRQTTAIDNALEEYDRRIFFGKLPMFVVLILIAVVILYYVATLSSLTVEDQRGEVALLRSRGANSAQILIVFALEGMTIAILSVLAGPLLAASGISVLGYTPAFSDLTGGARLTATISSGAYMMSALGGLLGFFALMIPAVQASRIGVTRHRQEAARPSRLPAYQRYYVDVLLLLLCIFLFRQLTEQGSMLARSLFGELAADQLLLALPALALLASAMVLLRLFPLAMSLVSRILSPWLPAGLAIGVWQMARNPTHYARLALLLILAAGLGIFASSFGATLERSFRERVLHATGSDIRIDGIRSSSTRGTAFVVAEYDGLPAVARASPVLRTMGRDRSKTYGESFVLLGVDIDSFSEVAWFRDDYSGKPIDELLAPLRVAKSPNGIELPYDASAIGISLKADRPHPTVRLVASIRNRLDRHSTCTLGELESGDWTVLETSLESGSEEWFLRDRPLTLVSIRVEETGDGLTIEGGSILIDDIWVTTETGETKVVERFDDAAGWRAFHPLPAGMRDTLRVSDVGSDGDSGSVLFSWSAGSPPTGRGMMFHGLAVATPLPVLASKSFVRDTGHYRGEEFEISIGGAHKPVLLVDTVDLFPTVAPLEARFLVADLYSLDRVADFRSLGSISDFPSLDRFSRYVNLGAIVTKLSPNEMWLSTASSTPAQLEGLRTRLEGDSFYPSHLYADRAKRLESSQVDPLVEAGWKALLFIAFSAVLILSCLGFAVHAYVSFRNRQTQFALLRTLGFSMRQLITLVWLEQTLVIVVGLALGTWMGGRLGAMIMPFLGHDDWGGQVVPPFAMQVRWGALGVTYAIMVAVFAIIILGLIWLIRRLSLQRVLRLGDA